MMFESPNYFKSVTTHQFFVERRRQIIPELKRIEPRRNVA